MTEVDQRMRLVITSYCYGCHGKRFVREHAYAPSRHFRLWKYEIWAGSGDRRMAVYRRVEFRSWERAWISARMAWPKVRRALFDEIEAGTTCQCTAGQIKLTPDMACPNGATTEDLLCDVCKRQRCNAVIKYVVGPWMHARLSLGFQSHQITVDTTIAVGLDGAQWEEI